MKWTNGRRTFTGVSCCSQKGGQDEHITCESGMMELRCFILAEAEQHLVGRGLVPMVSTSRVMMTGLPRMLQFAIMAWKLDKSHIIRPSTSLQHDLVVHCVHYVIGTGSLVLGGSRHIGGSGGSGLQKAQPADHADHRTVRSRLPNADLLDVLFCSQILQRTF